MIYYYALLFIFSQIGIIVGQEKNCPYDFKVAKMEAAKDVEQWVEDCDMKLEKVNKSHSALGGKCTLKKQIPHFAMFEILGYERDENNNKAYREEPTFNITRPLCDFISNDKNVWPEVYLRSDQTFPMNCPIDPREVHLSNYFIDKNSLPPNPPSDFWLIKLVVHETEDVKSKALTWVEFYIELLRKNCNKKDKKDKDKKEKKDKDKKGKKGR